MKKYLAEVFGTFGLTLAVVLSLSGAFPVPTPVIAALTLGLFVYTLGHISGAHLNPAVTLGVFSLQKISLREAIGYMISQFLGAVAAMFLSRVFILVPPALPVLNNLYVGFAELVGAFFFTFGIAAVVYGKVPSGFSGVVIGGSLLLGISLAASRANGILNPAVAWGIGSFSLMYVLGPAVGAILGMWAFRLLSGEK